MVMDRAFLHQDIVPARPLPIIIITYSLSPAVGVHDDVASLCPLSKCCCPIISVMEMPSLMASGSDRSVPFGSQMNWRNPLASGLNFQLGHRMSSIESQHRVVSTDIY